MGRCFLALALAALSTIAIGAEPALTVDLLVKNARIWTGDPKHPEANALAVVNGRVVFVHSSDAPPQSVVAQQTFDAKGARIVPGFYDSHVHLLGTGMRLS